jgi:hypothetical protein
MKYDNNFKELTVVAVILELCVKNKRTRPLSGNAAYVKEMKDNSNVAK